MSNTSTPHFAEVNSTHTTNETDDSPCLQAVATTLQSLLGSTHRLDEKIKIRSTHLLPFITSCRPRGEESCVHCIRTRAPPAELTITVLPRDSLLLLAFPRDLQFTLRFM
jgi:hypothetical protein